MFQKVLGVRGQNPNNVCFSFYGLKKGHMRLCLRTSTVETSELIIQGKVESRKVFNAEFEVSESSLVTFPLFLFYTTQHCWDGVRVLMLGVVRKRPLPPVHVRFLLTLQPRETAGSKSSSPMWTPVGELQCTPDVSERGVHLSLW